MGTEQNKYFIQERGAVRGPFTLSQISRMWTTGNITADALYRVENVEDWSALIDLEESLEAIAPFKKNQTGHSSASAEPTTHKAEALKDAPPKLQPLNPEVVKAKADFDKLRGEMVNSPGGQKLQSLIAKQLLGKGLAEGSPELTAHLENVAAGRPIRDHYLSGDECHKLAVAFRLKWALLYLTFWIILGLAWIGPLAVLGMIFSLVVLSIQLQWKKRQLLRAMGIPEAEVNRRAPGLL